MSVLLECDRCGAQEQTRDVMLFAGLTGPGIPTARPELPDGWTRPTLPTEDDELRGSHLCPGCKTDLLNFMNGVAIPGGTSSADVCRGCGHAAHNEPCREPTMPGAPGDADECGCDEFGTPDLGTGARPSQICPGCGHLRHSDRCPDHVPEVGPCGCKELTTRERMRELGIDD
ncbi:hypothetical protein ACFV16_22475 [Streptomyces massasporeus]|uniref:hypothetical protein n=1 Tax=Streptomyces massasporeus TaxID=67324 RepID=UPI003694559F